MSRPQYHLDLGNLPQMVQSRETKSGSSTAASSPIDQNSSASSRFPTDGGLSAGHNAAAAAARRGNNGSPSNDHGGSRFYPRRCVKLQPSYSKEPQTLTRKPVHENCSLKDQPASYGARQLPVAFLHLLERRFQNRQATTLSLTWAASATPRSRAPCHSEPRACAFAAEPAPSLHNSLLSALSRRQPSRRVAPHLPRALSGLDRSLRSAAPTAQRLQLASRPCCRECGLVLCRSAREA